MTSNTYVELHCHSNYSFQEGASSIGGLLARAGDLGYRTLALTDHDNLCGAMEFARAAAGLGIQPITGAEVTLQDGSHLTLLAETRQGYANLCNLVTYSRIGGDRLDPGLDPKFLSRHAEGLILLTGCSRGAVPALLVEGKTKDAEARARDYLDWFGPDNVFFELQRNLVHGDRTRNNLLLRLARRLGAGVVATNNVHYHVRERHRLQDALVAISHNRTLEETHRERRPNDQFHLKSPARMAALFDDLPRAVENSARIAERCAPSAGSGQGFDLTRDLGYRFPDHPVPDGHTPQTYLEELCRRAVIRRYGSMTPRVRKRLDEEFRLIRRHDLAGFFLIYHDIIQIARDVMIDLGLSDREVPLEERPPGRGRGSSVAMLVGYLIGLSHIDPLEYNLSLERFISDDMGSVPDIDLDFPRNIREELIKRVHERWGWDRAVLTGMIGTYKMKGCIRDLGKALGLPAEDIDKLSKRVDARHADGIRSEMLLLPDFRHKVDVPGWRDLIELASQLGGFPKYLAQHPGGMVIGSSPLIDIVPAQPSAIDGRYICHWDKDSIDDAGFVKIDFLALGALSQMQEALQLIEKRTGRYIDLSRIDFEDRDVYGSLRRADTIGIFQVESAAQMQTITRIRPRNLVEMAYEVAAARPGVGANDGVTQFIRRHAHGVPWDFDHPLEERALGRTLGVILFQDQVNQLAIDVAGFSPREADDLRRAFGRKNNKDLLETYWKKFLSGAADRGVPEAVVEKIFKKFSGQYMFPESHAFAFGVTAYQMAWLKHYYPLEFFVSIFNQQPMGFYNLETLKEDAKRHGIDVLNPDINESDAKCIVAPLNSSETGEREYTQSAHPELVEGREREYTQSAYPELVEGKRGQRDGRVRCPAEQRADMRGAVLLGFLNVKGLAASRSDAIVEARQSGGPFNSLADAVERTGLQREALEGLVDAGAFDSLASDRRAALWEVGLLYRPLGSQRPLPLPVEQDMAELPSLSDWDMMLGEYRTMGLHPDGHFMAYLRPTLGPEVLPSNEVPDLEDGAVVIVAGLVIRRQHPGAKAVFITLEDEFGHVPLVVWPDTFRRYRLVIREPVLKIRGVVSRREGTMNVVVHHVEPIATPYALPSSRDWG